MQVEEQISAFIKRFCIGAIVEGLDFWQPSLLFAPLVREHIYADYYMKLHLNGRFSVHIEDGFYPTVDDEEQRLQLLITFRKKKIKAVAIVQPFQTLIVEFEDGTAIECYDAWDISVENPAEPAFLLLRNDVIRISGITERNPEVTVGYFLFFMDSDEKVDIEEFAYWLPIEHSNSYSKGDLRPEALGGIYNWSSIQIRTPFSADYDATPLLAEFFTLLRSNQAAIMYLKEKYKMDLIVHYVSNIYNEDLPFVSLQPEQLQFLADIGAKFDVYNYDYR